MPEAPGITEALLGHVAVIKNLHPAPDKKVRSKKTGRLRTKKDAKHFHTTWVSYEEPLEDGTVNSVLCITDAMLSKAKYLAKKNSTIPFRALVNPDGTKLGTVVKVLNGFGQDQARRSETFYAVQIQEGDEKSFLLLSPPMLKSIRHVTACKFNWIDLKAWTKFLYDVSGAEPAGSFGVPPFSLG